MRSAQVVAADLRAPACSVVPDRRWVAALTEAAHAVVSPSVVHRCRAGWRLLLLTEAAEDDPEMRLWEESEVDAFLAHRPGPGARSDLGR